MSPGLVLVLSHLTGRGTWIGLVIRLDVDLALGQHLRKFPLQLLILLVVGNSINRSTESSSERRGVNREKNSQENSATRSWHSGTHQEEQGSAQLRRNRRQAGGEAKPQGSVRYQPWADHLSAAHGARAQTEDRDSVTAASGNLQRDKGCYIFPLHANKCFLPQPLHTTSENKRPGRKAGVWKSPRQLLLQRLPTLLRQQHRYFTGTVVPSPFTCQEAREQHCASCCHLFILHHHTLLGGSAELQK